MDRSIALLREALPVVQEALAAHTDVVVSWGISRPTDDKPVAVSLTLRNWTPAVRVLDDSETIVDATMALVIYARQNARSEEQILRDYYAPCEAALEQHGWEVAQGQQGIEDINKDVYRVLEAGFNRIAI